MQLTGSRVVFSPSELNHFLECEHLSRLDLAVARGELKRPSFDDPHAALIRRKGDEHERAYLESLVEDGKEVARIERDN